MYEQPKNPLKKILAWSAILIVFLLGFNWLWNTAFVQVSVASPTNKSIYTYQFINQKNGKLTEIKSQDPSIKKRLTKGSYLILVKQADTNYLSITKSGGFLRTTSVNAKLNKEKARRFVGDSPSTCMAYIANVLVSYSCTDLFENINIHQPASASAPTYITKNPSLSGDNGYVQGIAQTSQEAVALIKTPADSDVDGGYSLLSLGPNLSVISRKDLDNLDQETNYSLAPYKNGFIIYSPTFAKTYYYSSVAAQPTPLNLASPNSSNNLAPAFLSVANNLILTAYSSGTDSTPRQASTEIIINNGSRNSHYVFNKLFTSATPCGLQMLCAVDSSGLNVYSLTGAKPKQLYSLRGAASVISSAKGTLVVTNYGLLRFDATAQTGFLEYSFGDYKFNQLLPGINGYYILSLTNPQGKKVALYIDQNTDNKDQIDKQVLSLQKLPEVSSSSVYGRYVFISPNLGPLVYNNSLQIYDYDPAIKTAVNAKINQAIAQAGIDRSSYQIINTAQ